VNGYDQINRVLANLLPFIRFKNKQARAMMKVSTILSNKQLKKLTVQEKHILVESMILIQNENYSTHKKKSAKEIMALLDLTP
jgi:hypothetical protein